MELVLTMGSFSLLDVWAAFEVDNTRAPPFVIYLNKVLSSKLIGTLTQSFAMFRKILVLFALIDFSIISTL